MTIAAGFQCGDDGVWLAADQQWTSNQIKTHRSKIVSVGGLTGTCSGYGASVELLRRVFEVDLTRRKQLNTRPNRTSHEDLQLAFETAHKLMAWPFEPAEKNGPPKSGAWYLITDGRVLLESCGDGHFTRETGFTAIGSCDFAYGAWHALMGRPETMFTNVPLRTVMDICVTAAVKYDIHCGGDPEVVLVERPVDPILEDVRWM